MRNTMGKTMLGAALALLLAGAQAAPVSLSYSGVGEPGWWGTPSTATGTGFFSTKSGSYSGTIGLEDLESFSFTLTFKYKTYTDVLNFDLDTLKTFNASFGANGVDGLALDTENVRSNVLWGQAFHVRGQGQNQAWSENFDLPGYLSRGQITATMDNNSQVPEPASLALVLAALGGAGLAARKRRSA
ncbi:hypothetical protein DBR47_06850 [Paucibacter sp. KBW04]|uniref:PEP-CTERM sorting domain-containing protein n=1 Tax=Paucibacter sp. KBW04 TaxID=2153361 RepID=UPI000F5778C1|nr:PEP-CTERM sorting domain-containing protein [Paucibacter sp. KBW04]RQO61837.1 hypothetical protein DBR47_06850 [Paucibacter sp. KBW04]